MSDATPNSATDQADPWAAFEWAYDPKHPAADLLWAWRHGTLDAPSVRAINDHLGQCERCQALVEALAELTVEITAEDVGADLDEPEGADLPTPATPTSPRWRPRAWHLAAALALAAAALLWLRSAPQLQPGAQAAITALAARPSALRMSGSAEGFAAAFIARAGPPLEQHARPKVVPSALEYFWAKWCWRVAFVQPGAPIHRNDQEAFLTYAARYGVRPNKASSEVEQIRQLALELTHIW